MNDRSYICRYISENTDWRELLSGKNIMIKEVGELAILNYDIECDFTDPVVQEARGIIINTKTLEVVCWPFRKFANYGESYADDIDWNNAHVQEKVDGSIVKLWYDPVQCKWQWSTNSMIDAADAHIMDSDVSFMSLIRRAENYKDVPYDTLDREKTYIFELVAPEQKIVIRYEYKKCVFLRKVKDHPYWLICDARISAVQRRKDNIKKAKVERAQRLSRIEDKLCEMADFAQEEADSKDFDIIITRVAFLNGRTDKREYVINYVSDVSQNDYVEYWDICKSMRQEFGGKYMLRKVKKPDGKYITINEWLGEDDSLHHDSDEDKFIDIDEWIRNQEETDS